jgi:DNA-binding transcriptional LysR family regulator
MNLQQLDTLRAVAQLGSFTRAAEFQNVTQSTVSMRIAQLEEEFETKLLERSKRSILLTDSGQVFLHYANSIHDLTNDLKEKLACPEPLAGTIRIGVAELLAPGWMPKLVDKLNQQFPKLEVDIEVGLSNQMYDLVRNGALDVCFHPVLEQLDHELDLTLLGKVHFGFLASPRMELPNRKLRPNDLIKFPIISFGPDSVLSAIQARWLAKAVGKTFDAKRSNSMEVTAGLVRSGLGISFLPVTHYRQDIRDRTMREVNVSKPPPNIPFYAIRAKSNMSSLIQQTIEIAKRLGQFDS